MTHISDVHDYDGEPHQAKVEEFLAEGYRKAITGELEQIICAEFDRLEEYAGEHISQVAADRAERFLEKVLSGDEDAARQLLGLSGYDGRYNTVGYNAGEAVSHLIHGRLFEAGPVELRKRIVEAHADLLKDERVKDLEATVEGLTKQVRDLATEVEHLRDLRSY